MCVPESALRWYEHQLDKEYEASLFGFDDVEEYEDFKADYLANEAIDKAKGK